MARFLKGMNFVFIVAAMITSVILGVPFIISCAMKQDWASVFWMMVLVVIIATVWFLHGIIEDADSDP